MSKTIRSVGQTELCRVLVESRKSRGVTQAELAARLGCQQSMIARLENGERRLDVIEFINFARALAVAPSELLARVEQLMPAGHRL